MLTAGIVAQLLMDILHSKISGIFTIIMTIGSHHQGPGCAPHTLDGQRVLLCMHGQFSAKEMT